MKPFNLKEAQAGKPVCTRNGDQVRIICWDSKAEEGNYPIVALVKLADDKECIKTYALNGEYRINAENDFDLMMVAEKKEGWVNIYRLGDNKIQTGVNVFKSKENALGNTSFSDYITTVKVEWEE